MVEGGIAPVNKTEFTELFRTIWKTPYILRLAMTAGIGGLLFGYDTAVISGALLYIRDDFKSVDKHTWLQELIVPGTWRWMLGVAGIPPIVQFVLMLLLPESPRWLYKQGKVKQATEVLGKIYPIDEVGKELEQLKASIEAAEADEASIGNNFFTKFRSAMKNIEVRRALYAGVAVQVVQQFVGINSVMYYGASIMQLAGFASKAVALALSLITTGLNAFQPGSCLANEKAIGNMCTQQHRVWYDEGCPSKLGLFAVLLLGFYIIVYSLGMGTGPWIVNAEIYPLKYRGFGGGVAAMSNWTANLIVSMNFLSLTEALGSWGTFLLFAGNLLLVPETKGVPLEEIEKVLRKGFRPWPFERKEKAQNIDGVPA
ncbi:inositol transporter 1 [Quercus suber]|uniref:Inositol transporter 1 n=1 Tax=Quercus suber TaxID=58331 RepID=A0AAW0LWJ7_QUESU